MLTVTQLTKTFATHSVDVAAVSDVSFTVDDGQLVSIVGRSGSGKSTLLNLLGGLEKPTSGTIAIDGRDLGRMSEEKLARYRAQHIGFVFQSYNLIPNLTALENVVLAMEAARKGRRHERIDTATALLTQVGLEQDQMKRKPSRLSGGQQQRVAIARALANKPSLVLADEPTGNLDEATSSMIIELLRHLASSLGITFIIVTHDPSIAKQADNVLTLKDGKVQ